MHPGGGHFVILSRLIGCGAAAAMALFGEEIDGTPLSRVMASGTCCDRTT